MNQPSVSRQQLEYWLAATLQTASFKDYCPNGLQVEGSASISRIITGVSATQALIDAAIEQDAQAILVHHGWFWKNEDPCIRGMKRARLAALIEHDINLFAYHLPLDAHPQLGNNAQLAARLGWQAEQDAAGAPLLCGPDRLIWLGKPAKPQTRAELCSDIARVLGREPLLIGAPEQSVRRLAWCSGAAQGMFADALAAGADCYVSGEISEPTVHSARETGCAYVSAGHHATERYGVQALGAAITEEFGVECRFIDIPNPV